MRGRKPQKVIVLAKFRSMSPARVILVNIIVSGSERNLSITTVNWSKSEIQAVIRFMHPESNAQTEIEGTGLSLFMLSIHEQKQNRYTGDEILWKLP